jgi:hypothetical protein
MPRRPVPQPPAALFPVPDRRQGHSIYNSARGLTPIEVHMGALMITCPNTGQPISTGIETDEYSLKQIDDVPARTRCPFCGLDHTWWKREAWLADRLEQPLS